MSDRKIEVTPVECPVLSPERQLLWDAANIIERKGWGQGDGLRDPKSGHCVVTAINAAQDDGCFFNRALDCFKAAAGIPSAGEVFLWNDAPERTAAEVIQALRDAALASAQPATGE